METTIQAKPYSIYHETMGHAIAEAKKNAENKGWTVDARIGTEWEAMHRETHQTKLYKLHRSGRATNQCMNITLYRMPSGRYELVTYII